MRPRLVGLYALATMEREGVVHGYLLSQRISERTDGAWRPGPGAVYPSLSALVERGWARRRAPAAAGSTVSPRRAARRSGGSVAGRAGPHGAVQT